MRKIIGLILLGLGSFLLITAVLATVYLPGVVKKTPLDTNSTTILTGEAQRRDADTGQLAAAVPIRVTNITQADGDKSDDDVIVFVNGSCVVENADGDTPDCVDGTDPRLVSATEATFATDRKTGLAVDNADYLPDADVQYEGLVNKWPFDAEKKDYEYFDATIEQPVEAVYVGTEDTKGLETYHFKVDIDEEPLEIAEGVQGTYSNEINIWIDPLTGTIVNQTQDQQRYLDDGTQVLNLQAAFTDEQIEEDVASTEDNRSRLDLITGTVPIVGYSAGALALIAGIALLLTARGRREQTTPVHRDRVTV